MDEINALIPGDCKFELVEDKNANKKYNSTNFVKPKADKDSNNPEHLLAEEYGNALKKAMEDAMQETFDIINSEIPAGATVENSLFWKH